MKKIATLFILIFSLIYCCEAQKLSKDEVIKYNAEVESLLQYLEETLNFIGDASNGAQESRQLTRVTPMSIPRLFRVKANTQFGYVIPILQDPQKLSTST